jgi:hypothetical protein
MNKYVLSAAASCLLALAALPATADTTPAATTCKDGTTSTATGQGACSHHGGVQAAAATPAAPPAAAKTAAPAPAAPAAAANPAPPAGATAKCNDGTYSTSKNHSGACSKHGGVASWLTAS